MPNVIWTIEFEVHAKRDLGRLDVTAQRRVLDYLQSRVASHPHPRSLGEPLSGRFAGLTRWRVGDYRVVGKIVDQQLIVVVVTVGHRREIYR